MKKKVFTVATMDEDAGPEEVIARRTISKLHCSQRNPDLPTAVWDTLGI